MWAMKYMGKPWENGKDGPNSYDCYGLIRAVYREELGIDLPVFDINAHSHLLIAKTLSRAEIHADANGFYPVDHPQEFDWLTLSYSKKTHHVGIWVNADGGGLLHSMEGCGVVFQSMSSLNANGWKIRQIFRKKNEGSSHCLSEPVLSSTGS